MPESLASGGAGRRIPILLVRVGVTLALGLGVPFRGRAQTSPTHDLTQFSLKDKLAKTGTVVFVITPEDIQRKAATTIPGLPRMVPGVDVAQIDSNAEAERSVLGKITWRF